MAGQLAPKDGYNGVVQNIGQAAASTASLAKMNM